jgi:hypothetical protein
MLLSCVIYCNEIAKLEIEIGFAARLQESCDRQDKVNKQQISELWSHAIL